jgi:flotillin
MQKKANSWQAYNEAAIVEILLDKLPEIAKAVADPLSRTERIVIVNTGGDSAGASKITKDMATIIAQVPDLVEALSGVDLRGLTSRLPGLAKQQKPAGEKPQEKEK